MDIEKGIAEMKEKLMSLLNSELRDFKTKYDDLTFAGVYVIYEGNNILYVGESGNVRERLFRDLLSCDVRRHCLLEKLIGGYFLDTTEEIRDFLVKKCKFKATPSISRVRLESFAIGVLNPKYNNLKGRRVRLRRK